MLWKCFSEWRISKRAELFKWLDSETESNSRVNGGTELQRTREDQLALRSNSKCCYPNFKSLRKASKPSRSSGEILTNFKLTHQPENDLKKSEISYKVACWKLNWKVMRKLWKSNLRDVENRTRRIWRNGLRKRVKQWRRLSKHWTAVELEPKRSYRKEQWVVLKQTSNCVGSST